MIGTKSNRGWADGLQRQALVPPAALGVKGRASTWGSKVEAAVGTGTRSCYGLGIDLSWTGDFHPPPLCTLSPVPGLPDSNLIPTGDAEACALWVTQDKVVRLFKAWRPGLEQGRAWQKSHRPAPGSCFFPSAPTTWTQLAGQPGWE